MNSLLIAFAVLAAAAPPAEELEWSDANQTAIVIGDCYQQQVPFDDGTATAAAIAGALVSACAKQLDAMEDLYRLKVIELAKSSHMLTSQQQDALAVEMLKGRPALMRRLRETALTAVLRARKDKVAAVH